MSAATRTPMEQRRDVYEVLGVARNASADEIRKAYRQAALKHHPDRNNGDPTAAERFKEATEAFQILSDEQRRAVYDQYGFAGLEGGPAMGGVDLGDIFGNFQDLFSEFFGQSGGRQRGRGGARRGPDIRVLESLSLRDAAFGCKRELLVRYPAECEDCHGSGAAPGTTPVTCGTCRGSGQVSNARGFVMFTAPCPSCRGEGRVIKTPCAGCSGSGQRERNKKIVVTFPAGIDDGQVLRVTGQGVQGEGGAGDVLVQVQVEAHPNFERHGADLATRVKIGLPEAIEGGRIHVPTLDDEDLSVQIPPGTQSGHVMQVRGHGVPRLEGKSRQRGTLHVVIEVEIPSIAQLGTRGRELLDQLRRELGRTA